MIQAVPAVKHCYCAMFGGYLQQMRPLPQKQWYQVPQCGAPGECCRPEDSAGKVPTERNSERNDYYSLSSEKIWTWGVTYGSILGWMNIHLPPILMFTRDSTAIWVWVKIKPPGDRRFWSMFPLTRVPFWVQIFDPPPDLRFHMPRMIYYRFLRSPQLTKNLEEAEVFLIPAYSFRATDELPCANSSDLFYTLTRLNPRLKDGDLEFQVQSMQTSK